tara:strand:+ start:1367 stop:2029 length:663 start_codon:yes stop_codon:yes gene_type:complete
MSELNVDLINEQTSANGVTIDGVLIKDGTVDGVDVSTLSVDTDTNGLFLISSATASASSELLFDNFVDTSTYAYYHIVSENIIPATNGSSFYMTFRSGGASGADLNGAYYNMAWQATGTSASSGFDSNNTNTNFAQIGDQISTTAGRAHNGTVEYFPSHGTVNGSYASMNFLHFASHGGVVDRHRGNYLNDTTAATGARFYMSSGNIASGSVYIYGVKKT